MKETEQCKDGVKVGRSVIVPVLGFLLVISLVGRGLAADSTNAGVVFANAYGRTALTVWMPYEEDDNGNNSYIVQWKKCSESVFQPGDMATGTHTSSPYSVIITGLMGDTCYTVRATYYDPETVHGSNPQEIRISTSWDNTMLHNINRFPESAKWSSNGGWGLPGTKYGQIDCLTCHRHSSGNIKLVSGSVRAPNGTDQFPGQTGNAGIIFESTLSPDGFGDDSGGHVSSNKVCEYCHSMTSYHRYDTSAQTNLNHKNASDCITCHPHESGFRYLDCHACHGAPPDTGAHLVHTSGEGAAYGSDSNNSSQFAYAFNCGTCHPFDQSRHANGIVDIELYSGSAVGLKLLNLPTASRTGTGNETVCSDIYCHSDGRDASLRTYRNTPMWGASFAGNRCAGCHDDPPLYENSGPGSAGSNSHLAHIGAVGIHINDIFSGSLDKVPSSGQTGSWAAHGDADTATTISCNICHAATTNWTTRSHFSTGSAAGTDSGCDRCHGSSAFSNAAGVITNKAYHVNGVRDVVFMDGAFNSKAQLKTSTFDYYYLRAGWMRNSYKSGPDSHDSVNFSSGNSYAADTKSCAVRCHWETIPWGATDITCASCHPELKGGTFNL